MHREESQRIGRMSNRSKRRARRNLENCKTKGLIDEPKAKDQGDEAEQRKGTKPSLTNSALSGAPTSTSEPQTDDTDKPAQKSDKIMRPLVTIRCVVSLAFGFLDRHNGSIAALATVAIVFLTGFYVWFSKQQWEEMISSNKITSASVLTAHRPWIFVVGNVEATKPLSFDASGAHIAISFSVKNTGNSP